MLTPSHLVVRVYCSGTNDSSSQTKWTQRQCSEERLAALSGPIDFRSDDLVRPPTPVANSLNKSPVNGIDHSVLHDSQTPVMPRTFSVAAWFQRCFRLVRKSRLPLRQHMVARSVHHGRGQKIFHEHSTKRLLTGTASPNANTRTSPKASRSHFGRRP